MSQQNFTDGIAIIGMAGRFPGARNVGEFWANLCAGRESVTVFSDNELLAAGIPREDLNDPAYVRSRAILDQPEWFDASFFGFTPRDAELTDPQHRIFLECCWEAFEDAGRDPARGNRSVGVFASASLNTYFLRQVLGHKAAIADFTKIFQSDGYNILVGADKDYLATRVAFKLDLRGPALTIQTACSSSLVCIAQACASLQAYQCDMALAGGVSVSFPQERGHLHQEGAIPSADGHCRAFDRAATGTVFGAGCGVVLLKRLEEAVKDGDPVYAVIRSAALNNDGAGKMSYSAPSQDGQAEVVTLAHALANISADSISYVEAHGTGTPLGDPIEIAALAQAFRASTQGKQFCGLGSLKTNVGHLEAAAGVTGLIKVALALRHRYLPPTLHFTTPNPNINFAEGPFFVVSEGRSWTAVPLPRRAGVSSFGVGGTNAHAVVEEAPDLEASGASRLQQLLLLSARSAGALEVMTRNLADWLSSHPTMDGPSFADLAFTLQQGRSVFAHRRAVVASNSVDAVDKLRKLPKKFVFTSEKVSADAEVVFLFPGQGAQYTNMGLELYEREPVFRQAIDRCAEILQTYMQVDIRGVLYPTEDRRESAALQIHETLMAQPSIFSVEYAFAALWLSWGIRPSIVLGHSLGEYVCAVLAQSLTLDDALRLVALRAKMMQALPAGSMLAVRRSGAELESMLPRSTSIAAYNSDKLCTVSGSTARLKEWNKELEAKKIAARFLPTSHAFHSVMMDPILPPFTEIVAATDRKAPALRWISTYTGKWMTAIDMADPTYWSNQMRYPVRFVDALHMLERDESHVFLEVGPGKTLSQLAHQDATRSGHAAISSLDTSTTESESILVALGRLWIAGVIPNWDGFYSGERRQRISLPTYAFEKVRHWAQPQDSRGAQTPSVNGDGSAGQSGANGAIHTNQSTSAGTDSGSSPLEEVLQQQLSTMRKQLQLLSG